MLINIHTTPNPNALKFIVPIKWLTFVWECSSEQEAKKSILSHALWQVNGVSYLLFGQDFVSISKKDDVLWENIQVDIINIISDFLAKDVSFFYKEVNEADKKTNYSPLEEKILKVIDEKVQPAIQHHGGLVKFLGFKNGVVTLDLQGACKGCPSAAITLKNGIENLLKYYFPEINEVIGVGIDE